MPVVKKTKTLALGRHEKKYIEAWQAASVKFGLAGQRGPSWRKVLALLGDVAVARPADFEAIIVKCQNLALDKTVDTGII